MFTVYQVFVFIAKICGLQFLSQEKQMSCCVNVDKFEIILLLEVVLKDIL